MRRRRPFPLWFPPLCALLVRAALHALDLHWLEESPVQLAFFAWLIPLFSAIWAGVSAVSAATSQWLLWAVQALWTVFRTLGAGLVSFGHELLGGLRRVWYFLDGLYDKVLRPAWLKLWHFIDAARAQLERIFKPLIQFVRAIRSELLAIYDRFVRPVLDTIDAVRKGLRVLSALGLDWAAKLDAELARLQDRIVAPFLFVLRKLNDVINVLDRIMTADGFFQRITLYRSLVRYEHDMWIVWWQSVHKRELGRPRVAIAEREERTVDDHAADLKEFLRDGGGEDLAFVNEHAADLALWFQRHA